MTGLKGIIQFVIGFVVAFVMMAPTTLHAATVCEALFSSRQTSLNGNAKKIFVAETVTHWYSAIEFGYHDKLIEENLGTGRRKIVAVIPENPMGFPPVDVQGFEIMPGAPDDASSYYADVSIDHATGALTARLYSNSDSHKIADLNDKALRLTWKTYVREGTLGVVDLNPYIRTENELAPQRKITFVTEHNGQPVAVMRVYDGSPYPTSFIGSASMHLEAPQTDPRIPIERRYPKLNLRESSNYIFEAGRLAISEGFEGGIDFKFANFGAYLMRKFGFLGVGPREFMMDGRIYGEITSRHLKHYLKSHKSGGLGFTLFAMSKGDGPMNPVDPAKIKLEDLESNRRDKQSRFIVYISIPQFISQFYQRIELRPAHEAYPQHFSKPNN